MKKSRAEFSTAFLIYENHIASTPDKTVASGSDLWSRSAAVL
jgi:hypothetical protein